MAIYLVMVYTINTLGEGKPYRTNHVMVSQLKTPRKENLANQTTINMEHNKRKSSRIARRAVKQGARPSVADQAGVEKLATGTNSSTESLNGNQNREETNPGPSDKTPKQVSTKGKRTRWTRQEYKHVLYAYYYALEKPSETNCTTRTYNIWRRNNKDIRTYIDANKLANVRRDIIKNKRLTDVEIHQIKEEVRKEINNESKENTPEEQSIGKEQSPTLATDNIVGQIFENRDTITEEVNEVETEQMITEARDKESTDAPEDITPELQSVELETMRQNILRELGVTQNIEANSREPLRKIQNNKKNQVKIRIGNQALREIIKTIEPNINQLNNVIYATAKVITDECTNKKKRKENKRKKPTWKEKIER